MDMRAGGKGYDEFVRRAIEEDEADLHPRPRLAHLRQGRRRRSGAPTRWAASRSSIEADMVVLATAVRPQHGVEKLAQKLIGVSYDEHGFLSEAHPKLRPVETNTAGIFLAGACQAPKDIPEAVARRAPPPPRCLGSFRAAELEREPIVASVNQANCIGCYTASGSAPTTPSSARDQEQGGQVLRRVAHINTGLCQGCGACVATCRSHTIDLDGSRTSSSSPRSALCRWE